ncbi:hypothetical protein BDN71DRAFT_1455602 [Pleurotus eryngii]|uniref:Galactose oxidase n=1 Tax=Pleurotus eryngii TaxID=5323 RepID=A0A9P5ZQ09_PLEER|nr:hypothetical protein BDN71DRAFT_1455602 [Pleurotus eryngii]
MTKITLAFVAHLMGYVWGFDPLPRWGQSQMIVGEAIFVYGGKIDAFNSFGYTGAPSTNELLILPLSSPFSALAPPWALLASSNNESTSQGPHIAWSTLSPVNTSMALLLGGIADPNSDISIQTRADSAILIDVFNQLAPNIIAHPDAGYANEPVRRMQHAACTAPNGRVFIIGGVRADGSGTALSQHVIFDPSLSFTSLGSDGGPPAIYGHNCIMLPNGHLLVFGGLSPISGGLIPFDAIWVLDTSRIDDPTRPDWFQLNITTNALPGPRRNFAAALLGDGRILIHGGQDASAQAVYSDGWILDLSGDGGNAVWEQVEVLNQLGARRDHFAVASGNEVIFGFGYSSSAPAPAPLQIYDSSSNAFVASHIPPPSPPSPTIPGPVQTSKPAQTNANPSNTRSGVRPTRTSSHGGDGEDDDGNGSGGDDGGGHGGNDNGDGADNVGSRSSSVTAIAVGSALGALGVFLIVGGVIWYYRRQSREEHRKGLFAPLDDGEDRFGSGSADGGVGVGIVSAAVGTAAGLLSEKHEDHLPGGAPSDPFMDHPGMPINDLANAPTRNHIYSNISNASFATPFTPSPTSSRFSVTYPNQGSDGVVGAVGRGVGTVTSVVGAGVASLAGLLGLSSAHQRAHYAHGDTRPPPSAVRMLPERRDMLSDEDTREFAYPNPSHRRWRSGASSERRRAWFDYERRRADGSTGSAWSLLSIFGAGAGGRGARSREPSRGDSGLVSSRVATPWNEKGDPFDSDWSGSGSGYGEEGYVSVFTDNAASGGSRPGMRREYSHSSAPSRKSSLRYVDPFADPAPPEKNSDLRIAPSGGVPVLGAHVLSGLNRQQAKDGHAPENGGELGAPDLQLPSIRTALPSSQTYTQTLSTLSEQSSHPSLQSPIQHTLERTNSPSASHLSDSAQLSRSRADSSASSNQLLSSFDRPSSSHTSFGVHQAIQQQPSPLDTPSTAKSHRTSYFGARPSSILDPPTSLTTSTTLISSAPTQPLRRSDTWWGRFARTRFLDRGSSDALRRGPSGGLVDIRDPNPPPRLNPIEENQHSGSATSGGAAGAHEKAETHVQGIHNGKSTTSLQTTRTMDSEALERLGGTMQVVQRIRDASGSADSGNASFRRLSRVDTLSSNDSGYDADVAVLAGMFTSRSPEELPEDVMTPLATSPFQTPDFPGVHPPPTKTPSTPSPRPPPPRLAPGGKVASRVAAYERRMSQDVDSPIASPVGVKEDKTRRKHVDYGLVPRPSLFVTNPDSRKGSTGDS